jgi:cytochrome c-type biogenesis protein CcsB
VPALQSKGILAAHVGVMVLAYAALSLSFGAAVLYLLQGGGRRRLPRLPTPELLDEMAFRSVAIGFPLLALGIALGAYWGNSAWGRYWGWDPKETSALATWLLYGVYLHLRGLRGWRGTRSAVLLVAAYGAVLFTYFAVNLVVAGLHSYAGL